MLLKDVTPGSIVRVIGVDLSQGTSDLRFLIHLGVRSAVCAMVERDVSKAMVVIMADFEYLALDTVCQLIQGS